MCRKLYVGEQKILKFNHIFFAIAFFLLPWCKVSALDAALHEIDTLINKKEYNKALKLITEYMRTNPKNFDEAEKRVQDIFSHRDEYAEKADDFIEVLVEEPENDKKKLDMIVDLENTEKNPGKAEKEFIVEAKKAAQFAYFRSQYARIQRESAALIAEKQYAQAFAVYGSGFLIFQKEFFDTIESEDAKTAQTMHALLEKINANQTFFETAQPKILSAYDAYIAALNAGDIKKSERIFQTVKTEFSRLAAIHNDLLKTGQAFQDCYDALNEKVPELTDSIYIAFTKTLTVGGSEKAGAVSVIEAEWNDLVGKMDNAAYLATKKFSDKMSSAQNDSYEQIKADSNQVRQFAALSGKTNDIHKLLTKRGGGSFFDDNEAYSRSLSAMEKWAVRCEGLSAVRRAFSDEDSVIERLSDTAVALQNERAGNRDAVEKMISALSIFKTYRDKFADDTPYLQDLTQENGGLDWGNALDYHDSLTRAVAEHYEQSTLNLWQKLSNYFAIASTDIARDDEKRHDDALTLLGKSEDDPHFSRESLVKFEDAQKRISEDIKILESENEVFETGADFEETIAESRGIVRENIVFLQSLLSECGKNSRTAKNNVALAEKAQDEAERRYQQAAAAAERNDFEAARNSLARSRTKFNESLFYQEDADLRKRSDDILASLAAEIARAENALIVKEVRELITQARKEYFNGEFETAESLLIRAKDRWAITNVEENPEISSMLSLVNNALELKNGRELNPAAPLYPEMSQILNIAKKYFDEAQKQLKKNKRDKAMNYFDKALSKLHELQLVYPLNREASVLTLKIAQISDPKGFEKLFATKIETAKMQIKVKETRQQAYADLLDLYEINPKYPDLKKLIYDIEIEIGIRPKPVDKAAQQRAEALTAQAKKMIASGDSAKLQNALSLLNQAVAINADNSETTSLIDNVQTRVGGNASLVLSGEDEAKYQKAVQALQKNNVIAAKALVEQLLRKPVNQKSAKILELQKRVNALL